MDLPVKAVSYVIITPVRDEEEHVRDVIASVAAQTLKPTTWVIVDDGSSDATGQIVEEAAKTHRWIRPVHRKDRGARRAGAGVMEAFYAGYKVLGDQAWQYLVKLDGDLTFAPDYFERCFARFAAEPRLGIAGGLICNPVNGTLLAEADDPSFHVRGATKIYRYECWQAIGGLVEATGWDTVDEFKANMLGWTTRTLSEIKLIHHRHAGAAYGTWSNWLKNGYANYVAGYHPLFMLLKCAKRSFKRPYGVGALGLAVGFCQGYLKALPQVQDTQLIRYIRREQMKRLLLKRSLWD
jgi:poly-beta-1,6-N-acetyl-D-glucosamine synthase